MTHANLPPFWARPSGLRIFANDLLQIHVLQGDRARSKEEIQKGPNLPSRPMLSKTRKKARNALLPRSLPVRHAVPGALGGEFPERVPTVLAAQACSFRKMTPTKPHTTKTDTVTRKHHRQEIWNKAAGRGSQQNRLFGIHKSIQKPVSLS